MAEDLNKVLRMLQEDRPPIIKPEYKKPNPNDWRSKQKQLLANINSDEFAKQHGFKVEEEGPDKWAITYADGQKDVGNFLSIVQKCIEIATKPDILKKHQKKTGPVPTE